ncbi:hypothetical protein NMG29_31710 [Streptomyces cocklensis]|uniref:Uncharacterized protein n=1 Tax=Actinacidiphila cocklensis TaxID=887465 RepID=A0A9W4DL68_9ACTN|nr:hypothetical protein [Actinacidiphila cocklensis]MDD1062710.1 hypothetical protein [Actinacidiphila cocklensis]CAG6392059.1 conserved hypothetical protein [Actinacidiphila cocklensis]
MVSAARRPPNTAYDIEATAEGLQEELARLEIQKQALERELSAVVAHLGSVQRVLGTLRAVLPTQEPPAPGAPAELPFPEAPAAPSVPAAPVEEPSLVAADGAPSGDDEQRAYGRLTEQILEFFAGTGGADVRARDVASALGRDTDNGSINAVRSTLDRLVGTSRIRRSGRGLYRAM